MIKSFRFNKLIQWEFWPYPVIYSGIFLYYTYLAVRFRHPAWFSAVNPIIPYGGLFGYSKSDVLDMLPQSKVPQFIKLEYPYSELRFKIDKSGLEFPLILKPDVGERGVGVELCDNFQQLEAYLKQRQYPQILQEYANHTEEYGIFCMREDEGKTFKVISITSKKFLSVVGDGIQNVRALLESDLRKRRYINQIPSDILLSIPEKNVEWPIQPIGNHNRGTTFLDMRHLQSMPLEQVMSETLENIEGFRMGRLDVRCHSWADLLKGQFTIIELNGAASEPTHIYQPGFSFNEAQKTLFRQWHTMARIAKTELDRGAELPPISQTFRDFGLYRKKISAH
jgi:hypothetical protein